VYRGHGLDTSWMTLGVGRWMPPRRLSRTWFASNRQCSRYNICATCVQWLYVTTVFCCSKQECHTAARKPRDAADANDTHYKFKSSQPSNSKARLHRFRAANILVQNRI